MRTRVGGIVLVDNKIALMHRKNVKNRTYEEYYVFPGGGVEEQDKTLEDGCKREVKEEFGIDVEVEKLLYEYERTDGKDEDKNLHAKEYFYLCRYVSGNFGTGIGPEFSKDSEYSDSGEYLPELIEKEKIVNLFLLPEEIKEKLIKDIALGKI